jgi:hypothetical protein
MIASVVSSKLPRNDVVIASTEGAKPACRQAGLPAGRQAIMTQNKSRVVAYEF